MKKTQAVRNGLGRAQWPGLRAAWVVRDGLSSSLSLFFFFSFFLPSLGSSLICSGFFFDIYKG